MAQGERRGSCQAGPVIRSFMAEKEHDFMNQPNKSNKPDYQAALKEWAERTLEFLNRGNPQPSDPVAFLYTAFKQTALESLKNGLKAGRRKVRQRGQRKAV